MELGQVQKEADSAGRKAIVFGLCALSLAGLFGFLLAGISSQGPDTLPLVVVKEPVTALNGITEAQLKVVSWPTHSYPQGGFKTIEEVVRSNKVAVTGMVPGEPVLDSRLSTPDRGIGVSQLISPGMRAYVVTVNESLANAQIVRPGAFVDVIATIEDRKTSQTISRVILQNIRILAVGDSVDIKRSNSTEEYTGVEGDQKNRYRMVTLMVAVPDVEPLALAGVSGHLDLALRSGGDTDLVETTGAESGKLFKVAATSNAASEGAESAPRASRPAPRPHASAPAAAGPSIIKVRR